MRFCGAILLTGLAGCVGSIDDAPRSRPSLPLGAQPLHRLNRLEYNNTVRDLLATTLRPADAFPPDSESNGFDNMAEALQLTPTLLDRYYGAARDVIDDALDDRPLYAFRSRPADVGTGGYPVGDLWRLQGSAFQVTVTVPVAGNATITLVAGASQVGPAPAPEVAFELDGVAVETFVLGGSAAAPESRAHSMRLEAGPHTLRYAPTNFVNDGVTNTSNDVLVRWVEVRADEIVRGPGRELVYACEPRGDRAQGCYEKIIARFAERGWRRPLSTGEQAELVRLFGELRRAGEPDEQALRLVMRAVMTSSKFLYRARTTSDDDAGAWLDEYVLASRLSYFLWSSMPDERLLDAAAAGRLSSTEGLSEAVDWMLDDDKARGLVDGFAEQWLSTRRLATASPSPATYPSFDEALRSAMQAESTLLFADFLESDEPASALLRPGFAYVNGRLAAHYGLAPIAGEDFVRLDAGAAGRSGIASLSAWLTAQSDAEHSSPIKRGRWLAEHVLCEDVPPPPGGLVIPPIVFDGDLSVREQLERHRSDALCASCHSLLDVLGIGFEEFDGVGRRRGDEAELDTLGVIPGGDKFDGADGFAKAVDPDRFVGCLARKLLSYSVGRPIERSDEPQLDSITRQAREQRYTLRELIRAVVLSPAFHAPARMR